jgi:hypothetical protein
LTIFNFWRIAIENQQKINEKAAEKMADLHDKIKKNDEIKN